MTARTLTGAAVAAAWALLAFTGCGSAGHAGQSAATSLDPITESSTCAEWTQATIAQRDGFVRLVAPILAAPAKYQEGAAAQAYAYGVLAGRCHQAEAVGEASRTTLAQLLHNDPSTSGSTTEASSSGEFLRPLPAVTIGSESTGRWSVLLNSSILATQPLSGSAATGPTDRLLELRITVTYLSQGPPGEINFAERGFQVDELPQDLGLADVPTPEEQDAEGPESKTTNCSPGEIKTLCEVIGSGAWSLYSDEDGTPGGTIFQSNLTFVEPNQSESFWLVGHISEHAKPTHIVLAVERQPLSAIPKGSAKI